MSILAWIIIGLIAGLVARAFVPAAPGGWLTDLVVGMLGAVVGGWIFSALGSPGATGFSLWSILVAIVGAIVLLMIYRALAGRRVHP